MSIDNLSKESYNVYRCDGFGVCKGEYNFSVSPCPMTMVSGGFESETPRGMMTIARGILEKELDYTKEISERIYRCTQCGNCQFLCGAQYETGETMVDPSKVVLAMRADLVENSLVPTGVRDFLKSVYRYGNPYKMPAHERDNWAKSKDIEPFNGHEFLFYVGCVGSYDERGKKVAAALSELLKRANLDFGILGTRESCDGNEVNMSGEIGLFELLAEQNIKQFNELGVKRIVTLSPHSFNALKNEYPVLGGDFTVIHYTQLLRDLLISKKIKPTKNLKAKATFHDPCFLGRRNKEYDAPRELLRAIPDLEVHEMAHTRENALCCGGGGGNFFTDLLGGGENSPSRVRVREAQATGAQILAVACPYCAKMFEDAIRMEGMEDKLVVKDVSELMLQSCLR